MIKTLIVAGDPSGDLIASQLVTALKKLRPDMVVSGLGGKHLEKVSDFFLGDIVRQHALGFAISPRKILFFRNILNNVLEPAFDKDKPDIVIPVDFYGFNSRVACLAKARGIKVFYYASPQFWASRAGRVDRLKNIVDLFLCLFPFEAEFYRKRRIPAEFVGHPIVDAIPTVPREKKANVEAVVGLLPGSRPEEIERHLPVMARACRLVHRSVPGTRFILFTVPHVSHDFYKELVTRTEATDVLIEMVEDENYAWRSQLDLAITASGMETLENTMLGIPMVVMYKMNWITYAIARLLIKIPYVAMPNLLFGEKIVPEFIQSKATPKAIAAPLLEWLKKPADRAAVRSVLLSLREKLGERGASDRAARTILEKVA